MCDGVYMLVFHLILRYIHVYCIDTVLNLRTHSCVVHLSVGKLNVKRMKLPCNIEAHLQKVWVVQDVRHLKFNSNFNVRNDNDIM